MLKLQHQSELATYDCNVHIFRSILVILFISLLFGALSYGQYVHAFYAFIAQEGRKISFRRSQTHWAKMI